MQIIMDFSRCQRLMSSTTGQLMCGALTYSVKRVRLGSAQGRSFACLPRLQELRIEAITNHFGDIYEGVFLVKQAGLPAGLQTLEVGTPEAAPALI